MVSMMSLVVPILVSAVVVFIASAILHMVIPFHKNDLRKVPREDEFLEAIRRFDIPSGDYCAPYAGSAAAMKDPAFVEKRTKGPTVLMTLTAGAPRSMSTSLGLWFLYCVLVSVFAAYIASRASAPGAEYLEVFRFVGTTAFVGYSLALLQNSIWYMKDSGATFRSMIDGLAYALLTAGVFGWLWPA